MGVRVPLSTPDLKPPDSPVSLWVTRAGAVLSLLLMFLGVLLAGMKEGFGGAMVAALLLSPFWILLLVALVRLEGKKVREGARRSALVAGLSLVATLVVGAVAWEEGGWALRALVSAFGLTQVILLVSAVLLLRISPVPPPAPLVEADPRWIKRVQALALVSLAATLGPIAGWSVATAYSESPAALFVIVASVPAWGWYALVWQRLRGRKQKEGLAIAITIGLLGLLVGFMLTAVLLAPAEMRWWAAVPATFVLVQAALVAASIRTYYTMPREAGDWGLLGKWVAGFGVIGFVVLILAGITVPGTMRSRMAANESSAVASLRTIVTAAVTYSNEYGHGYPPALAVLGPSEPGQKPSCRAADLVDALLVSGEKGGYRIEYRAQAPAGSATPGCPTGATSFVAVARPLSLNRTGIRSFFVDESGVIRAIPEDREATAADPPVQ